MLVFNHFYNKERYARSRRWIDSTIGYYKLVIEHIEPEQMIYFDDWLRQMYLREGLLDRVKEENWFDKWLGDWKDSIISVPVYANEIPGALYDRGGVIFALVKNAESGRIELKYDLIENQSDWLIIRSFDNISAYLEPAGLYTANGRTFMLLKNERSNEYSLFHAENDTISEIQGLPVLSDYAFLEYGDHVYLTGNNAGYFEMYEIVATENGFVLNHVESAQKPSARTLFNSYGDESGIYFVGGGNSDGSSVEVKRDIWKFDAENGWQIVNADTGKELFHVFIRRNGDELLIVDMESLEGNISEYMIVDLNGGLIVEEGLVQIGGVSNFINPEPCLTTDSASFWQGFNTAEFCSKFTDPEYAVFNAGTTVNAVDGFGKYLFVAYEDGIKAYDISEPTNPVLKSNITLYGNVKDILVEKTRIFAATGNGIDVLKFDGTQFTVENHIPTYGNSASIRKYGKYLVIGDGQGLKKLDTETLEIVQQVNTSGDVTTLVIQNGTIHLYGYSGLKRYDAEIFEQIPTSYSYKSNPKLSLTIDNGILVSFGGKVYELTYNGNTPVYTLKTGDISDFAEGYAYNGYAYFPKGNKIRIATMTEVIPPVCGNGTVEIGETCDGNSVECSQINSDYTSGTAVCNSTCSGYNESNCSTSDGWF